MATESRQKLANFDLESPQAIDAEKLVGRGAYSRDDGFFLSLALIFNDLKGLVMHDLWLAPHRPATNHPTPFLGQWSGLVIQLRRLTSGVVWELCELMKAHRDLIEDAAFVGLLSRMPKESRAAWRALEDLAFERGKESSALATVLKRIRHNGAFHYYKPEDLVAGYRKAFYEEPESALNEKALASVGRDMEGTRFYYADAAAGALMTRIGESEGIDDFRKQLSEAMEVVNLAVVSVVSRHLIERRDGGLAPRPVLPKRGGTKRDRRRRR